MLDSASGVSSGVAALGAALIRLPLVSVFIVSVCFDGLCIAQAASISRSATLWGREMRTHCTNPTTTRAA